MKYGLISDIHGNLEALEAVFRELDKASVDRIFCLGDVVGYGPNPSECLTLVRERASVTLAGNHDHAPLGLVDISYFNTYAKRAVEWTASRLSEEEREFLGNCPLEHKTEVFDIVHSTPLNPSAWEYILSIEDAAENFPAFESICCFIGHSHVPVTIMKNESDHVSVKRISRVELDRKKKYIINIGSVGQPRDLDPRAAFAVFDDETLKYELFRVNYDIGKTQRKILDGGLPRFLAERLALGQ